MKLRILNLNIATCVTVYRLEAASGAVQLQWFCGYSRGWCYIWTVTHSALFNVLSHCHECSFPSRLHVNLGVHPTCLKGQPFKLYNSQFSFDPQHVVSHHTYIVSYLVTYASIRADPSAGMNYCISVQQISQCYIITIQLTIQSHRQLMLSAVYD